MIACRYRALLDHLGATVPLTELRRSSASDLVAMRHDVDHDLGVALDLSAVERSVGDRRATFFILHTQAYCEAPHFLDRLRQLVDDGHEIGLHLDTIGSWWRGETDDPFGDLERWLERVRSAGIDIVASAAHGSRACYEGGFANHWIWSDLRGDDPAATMHGISAEGIHVEDPAFQLPYPVDHRVRRGDNALLELWTQPMASLGIEYEACTVPVDRYWSDSGGKWTRSPDPVEHDLSRGRHQVLVHPWWWREPRRDVIILSTARSGTKWLCSRLAAGTSALVLHERTLNQDDRSIEPAAGLKRTAGDLVGLLEGANRVRRLVDDAFVARHRERRDTIEANVYLPHVAPELLHRERLTIVHLHRDPAKVVRSILERGWYDPQGDRRHPRFDTGGIPRDWDEMTRLEQACTYWAATNRQLLEEFPDAIRVAAEDLQSDPAAVHTLADGIGHVWHAIPGAEGAAPVDRTEAWTVPSVEAWSDADRRVFLDICGPVAELLQRPLGIAASTDAQTRGIARTTSSHYKSLQWSPGLTSRCDWERHPRRRWFQREAPFVIGEAGRGASVGLRRGVGWSGGRPSLFSRRPPADAVLVGRVETMVRGERFAARLFAIEVDRKGVPIRRSPLVRLDAGLSHGQFIHRLHADAIAVYPVVLVDAAAEPWRMEIGSLDWRLDSSLRDPGPVSG